MGNSKLKVLMLGVILVLGLFAVVTYNPAALAKQESIENRASKIFQLDNAKKKKLPSSDVVALSVAVSFKNYDGAEKILNRLERL